MGPVLDNIQKWDLVQKQNYNTGHTLSIKAINIVNVYYISVQPQNTKNVMTCKNLYTIREAGNPGGTFSHLISILILKIELSPMFYFMF